MKTAVSETPRWSTRLTFIFAATGSAVGLGNIWKFPYIAGENGGAAFVLVYLGCIALIGVPILLAEVVMGRSGRKSPVNTMHYLAHAAKASRWWSAIGWSGMLAGVLILSFYSVVAGWSLHYIVFAFAGDFQQTSGANAGAIFGGLLANVSGLLWSQALFILICVGILAAGVVRGLGRAVGIMMPVLFVLLLVLLFYSATAGNFAAGWQFMFTPDVGKLHWSSVSDALGHAFFTLSLGMGTMMVYGAYTPDKPVPLSKMVVSVALLDTFIALMAGLIIFPIVFAHPELSATEGPGLLFVSLPVAFGNMPGGQWFAVIFFVLIFIAALSSAISMIEPAISWVVERTQCSRWLATSTLGFIVWFVGLGSLLSFNHWAEVTFFGKTFFDGVDFLTANIMLPLGGLFISIFMAWVMPRHITAQALSVESSQLKKGQYRVWLYLLRYVTPVLVIVVFVMSLWK